MLRQRMKNKNEKIQRHRYLMWKARKGKTTWSSQTPKQITKIEEKYNEKLGGNDLEFTFV